MRMLRIPPLPTERSPPPEELLRMEKCGSEYTQLVFSKENAADFLGCKNPSY